MLDYHGLADRAAGTLAEVAARPRVTTRTVSLHVKAAHAAGTTLPLTPAVIAEATRRSTPAEDHLARVWTARTLGLPDSQRPGTAPGLSRDTVSANVAAAAWSAARVLTGSARSTPRHSSRRKTAHVGSGTEHPSPQLNSWPHKLRLRY